MLAGGSALLLAVAISGAALGASPLTVSGPALEGNDPEPGLLDTTATFEDLDGNGIDDDCQEAVAVDPEAAALAEAAADLDGDGTISVSEAAQSGRTGGEQCNHGGYVSAVARADCLATEPETEEPEPTDAGVTGPVLEAAAVTALVEEAPDEEACDEDEGEAEDAEDADGTCEAVPAPPLDPETLGTPGALGAWISLVARSEAVGGPNCNHGGAVSEAAKAAKALRDVARAERATERAAAKAERDAARAERAAERAAAKAERDAAKAERAAAKSGGQAKQGKPDKANGKGH